MGTPKALEGLKVLDFTRVYSGPYCTMLLGDLGAEVIKVEAVGKGDDTRAFMPMKNGQSGYFTYLNRSKKSITVNLKAEEGKEIIRELAKWADVIVENFSAGTIDRLGLGYEDIKKVNPKIIYTSISGFGQDGPYHKKAAYDAIAQAMGGMTYVTGYPGEEAVKVGPAISDASSGVHATVAILAALHYREKTGEGQYIDIAMMDTIFSLLENMVPIYEFTGVTPQRIGNANPGSAPYNMYHTKDSTVYISTANDSLFTRLINVMGQPDLIKEERFSTNYIRKEHEDEIDEIVEAWTKQHTTDEICEMLDAVGVPVAPVKSVDQLIEDPHLLHRDMIVEHEVENVGKVRFPGNPLKMKKTPPDPSQKAPSLSQHTDEVLKNILNYSDEEIEKLRGENII